VPTRRQQRTDDGEWIHLDNLDPEIAPQARESSNPKSIQILLAWGSVAGLPPLPRRLAHCSRMPAQADVGGVRKEDRRRCASSFSDARELVVGGAAGASTAIRSICHPISITIRLIVLTMPRAASWKGAAAAISLLPTPRGMSVAKCFGIVSGISGLPADTTQIGKRLSTAQATSMPTLTEDDGTANPQVWATG
jgi:hypothetical protein